MGVKQPGVFWDGDPEIHFFDRRDHSTNIAHAWLVVEKLHISVIAAPNGLEEVKQCADLEKEKET